MTLRAMYSGVSGLRSHQERMDVIGNNIANINTIGYKSARVTFTDIMSQTLRGPMAATEDTGSTNPLQVGLGVRTGSIDTMFSQGSLQNTGRLFDLAIAGEGFFALASDVNAHAGQAKLTRAGNFNIDQAGFLVNPGTGYVVMGRLADLNGNISDAEGAQAIKIDFTQAASAQVTRNIVIGGNLDSEAVVRPPTVLAAVRTLFNDEGTALNLQIGDVIEFSGGTVGGTNAAGTAVMTIEDDTSMEDLLDALVAAIDSVGGSGAQVSMGQDGNLSLTAGTAGIVDLEIGVAVGNDPGRESNATATLQSIFDDGVGSSGMSATVGGSAVSTVGWFRQPDLNTSISVFDSQGTARTISISYAHVTSTSTPNNTINYQITVPHTDGNDANGSFASGTTGTLVFNSDGSLDVNSTGAIPALIFDPDGTFPANGGVEPLSINIDVTGMTQYAAPSTAVIESQDGRSQGDLDSIAIDERGIIRGIFTNGVTRDLAQIMIAMVSNEQALLRVGDGMFMTNSATGEPVLGQATLRGRGAIRSGTLELSNVDLALEFTNMIITQRGFQANSRVITTGDEMLRDLVNII